MAKVEFSDLGNGKEKTYGVQAAIDGKVLCLRIPLTDAAIKGAPISASEKSRLVGNTSGFAPMADFPGLRVNVTAILPVK